MESFLVCFRAVAPIFLIMALGYLAQRLGTISRDDVPRLNKVAFRYFLSVTMFYNLYQSEISHAVQPKLLLFALIAVLAEFALATLFVVATEKTGNKRGVKIQGIFRSNSILIGIPLTAALVDGADLGSIVLLLAVVVPTYNVLAVVILEVFRGNRPNIGHVLLSIAKNPLIIAVALGLVFLLTPLKLPVVLESTLSQIAPISNAFMLFLLGAFFRFDGLRRYRWDLVQVTLGRLVVMPGIILAIAYFMGFRGVHFAGLIAVFGSATAVSSFTMAQQLGGDDELAGDIVVVTSVFCIATLFGWSFLFKSLGAF